jgi:hypothetical protein
MVMACFDKAKSDGRKRSALEVSSVFEENEG